MDHPRRRRRGVILPAALAALIACAVRLGAQTEAAYRSDARLTAPVTVALRNSPFSEVVKALAEGAGIPVVAGPAIADDKASLFMKSRPARDVMKAIADHFDFRWRANGKGYILEQTAGGASAEARLRDQRRNQELAAIAAKMQALLQLQGATDDQLRARAAEIDALLARKDLTPQQRRAGLDEQQSIRDLTKAGGRASVALYAGLGTAQRSRLADGKEVRIDELPPALADEVHKAAAASNVKMTSVRMTVGPGGDDSQAPPSPDDMAPVRATASLRITNDDSPFGPPSASAGSGIQLRVTLTSIRGSGNAQATRPTMWSPTVRVDPSKAESARIGADDPDLQKEVSLHVAARPVAVDPSAGLTALGAAGRVTLGEIAEQIGAASGLDVVADSFVRAKVAAGRVAGKHRLLDILNAIAEDADYSWEKTAGQIRLRSNLYFDDRPSEAPDRILDPVRKRVLAGDAVGLNDYADLAKGLTDRQIKGLDRYWDDYFADPAVPRLGGGMYGKRYDLRLWAALSPLQRNRALAGDTVPVGSMNRLQADAFVAALTAPSAFGALGVGEPSGEPSRAEVAAGAFRLTTGTAHQMSFNSPTGGEATGTAIMITDDRSSGRRAPAGPPPNTSARIVGPGGVELTMDPSRMKTLDNFTFTYLLGGNEQPAKRSPILIPQQNARKKAE